MTFLFLFPSHSHVIIPIPNPTNSRSYFGQRLYIDYLKDEKCVYCVVNSKQNTKLQQKHCNQTHHSSVIIIIITTITANHCSRFTVQRLWEFYFSTIKYAVPIPIRTIPIPIPISSPKLLQFPWESHGNGSSHSRAHLYIGPNRQSIVVVADSAALLSGLDAPPASRAVNQQPRGSEYSCVSPSPTWARARVRACVRCKFNNVSRRTRETKKTPPPQSPSTEFYID